MGIRVSERAGRLGPSRHRRTRRIALFLALGALLVSALPGLATPDVAHAQVPVFCDTCWMANGLVRTAINAGSVTYVGGDFTAVGPYTGRGAALDAATGMAAVLPRANNTVNSVVPDGSGGWYVGGTFTMLGTTARNRIAHITAGGTVDSWNPNANGTVSALALRGTTVYAAGSFTVIGGQTRNYIAALSTATGNAIGWNPASNSTIGAIRVSADGTTVYAGGWFTTIGGQARNRIAALSAATGLATAWNPSANSMVSALALSPDGALVYAGGSFTTIGGQARNRIAALSTATGLATAWNPNSSSTINTLALSQDSATVYAGGWFTTIGGQARNRIAALSAATGLASAWNPNSNSTVSTILLSVDGAILYAGGSFTNIGGAARNYIAALSAATGLATAWDPNAAAAVSVLAVSGTTIYAGGSFISIGRLTRNRIAALDTTTGVATSWNPNANGSVYTITTSPDGANVYAGGAFTTIGGQARNRIAALSAATGLATAWNPNSSSTVYALRSSGDAATVYAGGAFTTIGGQARNYIAALSSATGLATAWNPNSNSTLNALALSGDGATVYAGGAFTTIGGQARNRIAALSAATGLATAWNPNANSTLNTLALSQDSATVYAGGAFTTIGGLARTYIAALSAATGLATAWNPSANAAVNVLTVAGDLVYAGGTFGSIGGQSRNFSAALEASTGNANGFEPNTNAYVSALAVGSKTYLGGAFTTVGGQECTYLAGCEYPAPVVTAIDPSSGNQGQSLTGVSITGAEFRDVSMTVRLERGAETITASNVNRVSSTEVTCDIAIPSGATVADDWDVVVRNDDDAKSGTLEDGFSIQYPPPVVTGISPNTGNRGQTLSGVSVTGSAFRNVSTTVQMRRGAETIAGTNVTWVSAAQVTCDFAIPSGATVGTDWDVFFQHNDDSKSSTLDDAFTVEYPPPTVVSVTPASANNDGVVNITNLAGSGFRSGAGATLSRTGQPDINATNVVVVSGVRITCDFDLTAAVTGTWDVTVTNDDTKSDTLTGAFTVTNLAPTVASIDPSAANNDAPVSITDLAGTNFLTGATVKLTKPGQPDIDGTSVVVVSASRITCDFGITGAATGFWDVTVTNADLKSGTLEDGFSIQYPPPVLTGISPNTGNQGQTLSGVSVTGSAFRNVSTTVQLRRGPETIAGTNVTWVSAAQVTCDFAIPSGATPASDWDVFLQHNDDSKSSTLDDAFTVEYPPPTVVSVTPASANNDGVVHITNLAGSGFRSGAGATLSRTGQPDINATNVVVVSGVRITCDFDLTGAATGTWDVTVTNDDTKSDTLTGAFTVTNLAPTVASIDPGAANNDAPVSITDLAGTNFLTGATVKLTKPGQPDIDGTSVVVVSASRITCDFGITGAATGFWDVTVTNADLKSGTLEDGFSIQYPPPVVTGISPNTSCEGDMLHDANISGSAFRDVPMSIRLYKGSSTVWGTNIRWVSPTLVLCDFHLSTAPAGSGWSLLLSHEDDGKFDVLPDAFTVLPEPPDEPIVSSVSPSSGIPGDTVTVKGRGFGAARGTSVVTFNGVPATDYASWSDSAVVLVVPDGATTGAVVVRTVGGNSNSDRDFTVTCPDWYLAEGSTDHGFATYVSIENPNDEDLNARVTYFRTDGTTAEVIAGLPAMSQVTLDPADTLGAADFATLVECLQEKTIAVDRTMSWTGPGALSPEGHCSIGVAAPSKTWYLAEGCSAYGFETWLLVFNPNPLPATVTLTYMMEGWGPTAVRKVVPPYSRGSYSMGADIGMRNSSIRLDSDLAVVAERSMYRNDRREGSCSVGVTASSLVYYSASAGMGHGGSFLTEGTTAYGFESYILIQNPNDADANVTITYLTPTGPVPQEPFVMPPNSRRTVLVNEALPGADFSSKVASDRAIVAERAVYWENGTGQVCHASIGLSAPHTQFTMPDGQTSDGRETYLLVANPNGSEVQVEVTYLTAGGQFNVSFIASIPANSRATYDMADYLPSDRAAILVRSRTAGKKIMAERAMYWNSRGAGTATIGGFSD